MRRAAKGERKDAEKREPLLPDTDYPNPFPWIPGGKVERSEAERSAPAYTAYTVETIPADPPKPVPVGRPFSDPRNRKRIDGRSPIRIGVLDIETTSLNAAYGRVLCAVIKTFDPVEITVFRADDYETWKAGKRSDDKQLVSDLLEYLEDIDVVVAHNGVGFDLPFLRTRSIVNGLPPVNPIKILDPCRLARKQFRFAGNSLASIAMALDTENQKTPLSPQLWARAISDGDQQALDYIVEHCIADVETLEEITFRVRGFVRSIDVLGSWRG